MLSEYNKMIESYKEQKLKNLSTEKKDSCTRNATNENDNQILATRTNSTDKSLENAFIEGLKTSSVKAVEEKNLIDAFQQIMCTHYTSVDQLQTSLHESKHFNKSYEF